VAMQKHGRGNDDCRRDSNHEPHIDRQILQRFALRAEAVSKISPSVSRAFSQSF
jgi:hypothetical protein